MPKTVGENNRLEDPNYDDDDDDYIHLHDVQLLRHLWFEKKSIIFMQFLPSFASAADCDIYVKRKYYIYLSLHGMLQAA